ncbi:protein of unknown function [Formivibrio citricus]|uniref:DUF4845 domain-containing protein n=1 Tax=Formivibrio citricus TaxID=83765 RepID=A0A1I4WGC5_9NEIS|nr:DUF4845 domain-containing protein [Formivibrio citricus]SFN12290.1 protein of unknown function [Formivibrio citricus]
MKKQQGLSFFGFIIVAIFVAAAAVTFFKVVPVYNQYFSAKSTIARLAKESAGQTPAAIRESFSKNAQIGYIDDVKPQDLKVIQAGGVTRIVVEYEKVVPLVANISLLFDFRIDESSGKSVGN